MMPVSVVIIASINSEPLAGTSSGKAPAISVSTPERVRYAPSTGPVSRDAIMFRKLWENKMIASTALMTIILVPILLLLWWYMARL